ncbi:MAG: hypothetical protein WA047_05905, partial [Phenylobacterium sp.]|uniref:phosphotransferase-like protein n=1 Tax=Phenylobacterium sp. TaxID=1871053 RepID=UPI003BB5E29C
MPPGVSATVGVMSAPVQIVILNGVGRVGESSTARALQQICARPFLHVAMDAFLDMLPEATFGHADGMIFETRFVGLLAPLEVLEAREVARGDRQIGLARWQFDRVHAG